MNSYKTFIFAVCMSIFMYFEYLGISAVFINTICALFVFYLLFELNKKELFWGGFLSGIFWFWWIGYSFSYYGLDLLIIPVILIVAFVYGVLFFLGGLSNNIIYRLSYFFIFSFIGILGFNWFKIDLVLVNTYLNSSKYIFFALLSLSAVLVYLYRLNRIKEGVLIYFAGILILGIVSFDTKVPLKPKLNIYQNTTNIPQDIKWEKNIIKKTIQNNLDDIDKAVKSGYDLIIFPETSFALPLNIDIRLQNTLKEKSKDISILTGALYKKDGLYYNSTYLFQKGLVQIAHKVVLVPFGEAVPFPQMIRDWINDTFYKGAKDYEVALEPTTFDIKGVKFRNAICYEATTDDIYKNIDTPYVIAISNNAWFTPSVQPSLQKLLLKYYANKYDLMIYDVTNKSGSSIINKNDIETIN